MVSRMTRAKHGEITIHQHAEERIVEVGPGMWAPSAMWVREKNSPVHDFDVELELVAELRRDGTAERFVCRQLLVHQRPGGPPVTLAGIRSIPVGHLTRAPQVKVLMADPDQQHADYVGDWSKAPPGFKAVPVRLEREDLRSILDGGPTDEALRWVAKVYRLALVMGDSPTREVESVFELPRSTADRWVALARERGFLGKAEGPGKAGG